MSRSFAYDEAPYVYPSTWDVPEFNGSAAASQKFPSFTNRLLKSVNVKPTVPGTSNDVLSLISVSGTTTTTTALGTIGSGVSAIQSYLVGSANSPAGLSMAPGDFAYIVKGTDATAKYAAEIEYVFSVGASFSS